MKPIILAFIFATSLLWSSDPSITLSPVSLTLPTVTKTELHAGVLYYDNQRNTRALRVSVSAGKPKKRWRLYIRAQNNEFMPTSAGKPTSHLMWKENNDPVSAYQTLSTSNTLIREQANGNNRNINLDLASSVNWNEPVEIYDADLVFTLEWDD